MCSLGCCSILTLFRYSLATNLFWANSSLVFILVIHKMSSFAHSVSYSDILAADDRLSPVVRRTPLIENDALSALVGKRVLVKLECLQHTGSFKWRGGWNAVKSVQESQPGTGVIAYSSGNHAQGVARAAQILGTPAVIVMPNDAPEIKVNNTKSYGAEVIFYDRPGGESREAVGEEIANQRGLALVRPYDDTRVIAGQGTCGLEIASQAAAMGVDSASVFVCCGGGGLTSGIALALSEATGFFKVYPVEPSVSDDVCRSLISGVIEGNEGVPQTACDAIITPSAGELTFPILKTHCDRGFSINEEQMENAVRFAFNQLKVVAEPGGSVALAASMVFGPAMNTDTVIAVITGGNVDPEWFTRTLHKNH